MRTFLHEEKTSFTYSVAVICLPLFAGEELPPPCPSMDYHFFVGILTGLWILDALWMTFT